MKTITIKNIELQFDSVDAGADQHTAHDMIDRINEELPHLFNGQQPQILIDGKEIEFDIK
jgi:glutaredoxin